MMKTVKTKNGFTLIELMVAMAIFALMSAMMYGGFQGIIKSRTTTDISAARLKSLQIVFLHFGRDLRQISSRMSRGEYGEENEPLLSRESGKYILEMTRAGYPNPARVPRSHIQRVAYGVEDEILYKYSWPIVDRAQDSVPLKVKLIDNIEQVTFRFLPDKKDWISSWPPQLDDGESADFPILVEITIDLPDWGRIVRVYELPNRLS